MSKFAEYYLLPLICTTVGLLAIGHAWRVLKKRHDRWGLVNVAFLGLAVLLFWIATLFALLAHEFIPASEANIDDLTALLGAIGGMLFLVQMAVWVASALYLGFALLAARMKRPRVTIEVERSAPPD